MERESVVRRRDDSKESVIHMIEDCGDLKSPIAQKPPEKEVDIDELYLRSLTGATEANLAAEDSSAFYFWERLFAFFPCVYFPAISRNDNILKSRPDDYGPPPLSSSMLGQLKLLFCPCVVVGFTELQLRRQYAHYNELDYVDNNDNTNNEESLIRTFCCSCFNFNRFLLRQRNYVNQLDATNSVKFSWETKYDTREAKKEIEEQSKSRKVVLLGASNSGKTALFGRMMNESFQEENLDQHEVDKDEKGAAVRVGDSNCRIGSRIFHTQGNLRTTFLEIWDVPPDGHANPSTSVTSDKALENCDEIVLVFSLLDRKSFLASVSVKVALESFTTLSVRKRILLVGTFYDAIENGRYRCDFDAEIRNFIDESAENDSPIFKFVRVSSLSGHGVLELLNALCQQ